MDNPVGEPRWKVIPGDPYPYGLMVFCIFLPGHTEDDREKLVKTVSDWLSKWEIKYGGTGLVEVRREMKEGGKLEWILDPLDKRDHYDTAKRMALVALKLRQLENEMFNMVQI